MPYEGVTAPPPRRGGTGPAPAAQRRASAKLAQREEAANGVGQLLSFGCMVTGQLADAGAIGHHWPGFAHELAMTADNDPKLAKALDKLLEVGPYGNLIIAALPLVGQLLANHALVKPEAMAGMGVVHPETLTAEAKAMLARQAAEAARMQRQAEEDLRAAQMEAMQQSQNGSAPGQHEREDADQY